MRKALEAPDYATDKVHLQHYLRVYERFFEPLADKPIRLLELGVDRGGSLELWRDYFEDGVIVGLDSRSVDLDDPSGRIRIYQGSQDDTVLLDRIASETAPEGFDIIIDDCSHVGATTRISFWHLFDNYLKAGGVYSIEDWGTGYWRSWTDGEEFNERELPPDRCRFPSHDYGMVGFVKQLVDECGMGDATYPGLGTPPYRPSRFLSMEISHGLVIIVKPPVSAGLDPRVNPATSPNALLAHQLAIAEGQVANLKAERERLIDERNSLLETIERARKPWWSRWFLSARG